MYLGVYLCMCGLDLWDAWHNVSPEDYTEHALYSPQVFPGTLHPHTYPDPDNPNNILGRSELERRTDYIQPLQEQLGEQHPLLQLICLCLHNIPAYRPSAEELLQELEVVRPQIVEPFDKKLVKVEKKKLQISMMGMFEAKDKEIEQLRHDLQHAQVRVHNRHWLTDNKEIYRHWGYDAVNFNFSNTFCAYSQHSLVIGTDVLLFADRDTL